MRTQWQAVGWAVAALLAGGLALRWLAVTNTLILGLIGILPLLLAPVAIVAVALAWRSGRLGLRVAVGVLTLATVVTFVRPAAVVGCGSASAPDEIVVYTHNVLWNNDDHEAVATAIAGSEADVVVLQELEPQLRRGLAAHPSLAGFHRASDVLDERSQLALWSRWPLADVELSQVADRPQIEATVLSPHGEFRVHAVHLAAPVDGELAADWSEGIARLRDVETGRPAVVAGDFNATDHHVQFRSVLGQGWTDVHHPKGCGFDATWPVAGSRLPVPLLRLDHVLVTEHWEVLAVTIGPPQGSDHRSVVATVRLRR